MNLINFKPKRLFTFGCSFTSYGWSMWPEIISYDLNIPLYNYGRTGAGNQYISNSVAQANARHKFNKDDLIMICWTNVCREDRWINGDWLLPGNIFSQNEYDEKWIKKYIDPVGLLIRDLSSIHLTNNLLNHVGCQYHFLSMMNIIADADQWNLEHKIYNSYEKLNPDTGQGEDVVEELQRMYHEDINRIKKSFYEVLWGNNMNKRVEDELQKFDGVFCDGHPWPEESLAYLKAVFSDHAFKNQTDIKVKEVNNNIINEIKNYIEERKNKKMLDIWGFPEQLFDKIIQDYAIVRYPIPYII